MAKMKTSSNNNDLIPNKILLALMPFWDPLNPLLGISYIKSFLKKHGYIVKTVDLNLEMDLRFFYDQYFDTLKKIVPEDKKGNFYNVGDDVIRHHMAAHLNHNNENEYRELVKIIVFKTFYCYIGENHIIKLNEIIKAFFVKLEKYLLDMLAREKPYVLGLSVFCSTLPASMFAFKLAKEKFPGIMTVMGGGIFADQLAVGSPDLENFLQKTPYIDHFIVGEGEILLLKLLRGELPKSQKVYTLHDIYSEIVDLNILGSPDFSDFPLEYYLYLAASGSRSCPFQCNFCSETVNWGRFRKRDAKLTVEEMTTLYQKHGIQLFLLGDSLMNPHITELANEFIKSDIAIYWDGFLRADKAVSDVEKVMLWRRGGFYRARLGLESGSQRVLDLMDKRISVEQIREAVSTLAQAGIKTTTMWVTGYPGETEEEFQQTLDLIEELKDDIYEADCNPFLFYQTGQVMSDKWDKTKLVPLYPEEFMDILMFQTWVLDCEPTREEVYRRMGRFIKHCSNLGIYNPYKLNEIYKADERWKKLHENSVPSVLDFKNINDYIDECKRAGRFFYLEKAPRDDGDFGFGDE